MGPEFRRTSGEAVSRGFRSMNLLTGVLRLAPPGTGGRVWPVGRPSLEAPHDHLQQRRPNRRRTQTAGQVLPGPLSGCIIRTWLCHFTYSGLDCRALAPVVGGRHGYVGPYCAKVTDDHVGRSIPPGHLAPDLHHLASKLTSAPGKHAGPEDDLDVVGLVLDGHEDRPVPPARVLPRHRPSGHRNQVAVANSLHRRSREHV